MQRCGKQITGTEVYTLEGKEKPRHNATIFGGQPYPSEDFPEWTFFCKDCIVKDGLIW
jgi:hypothetical protein